MTSKKQQAMQTKEARRANRPTDYVSKALFAMADAFIDTLGELQQLYVVDIIPLYFFYSVGGDVWATVKEELPPDLPRMLATLALKYPSASERSGKAAREVLRMRPEKPESTELSAYDVYETAVRELYPMSFRERAWPQIRVLNARYLSQPLTNARVGRARVLQDQVDYLMRGENDGEMLDEMSTALVDELKRAKTDIEPVPYMDVDV